MINASVKSTILNFFIKFHRNCDVVLWSLLSKFSEILSDVKGTISISGIFCTNRKTLIRCWQSWKHKARKAATKGTTMISTGKTGHAKSGHVGTLLMSGQHQVKGSTSKRAVSHGDGHTIAGQSDQEHKM